MWFFSPEGKVNNKPSEYSILISFCRKNSYEIYQFWLSQPGGNAYHRGGNASGWSGAWTPFSPGTATAAQVLKGYTFSSAAGSNLTGTYDPGNDYNNGYNAGRSNIRVTSGSYYASSDENVYYSNAWRSRKVVAFNPGGTPMIAFAYRTNHTDSVIMTSNGLKLIIGTSFQSFSSDHDFNSSSVHLPTATNAADTWNWYCAVY